jgi:uracil-DNA glycosylase
VRVLASGSPTSRIMIVGEAPGYDEDRAGRPFVGASGHELTKMLEDAGMRRDDCYITNVIKTRPPENDIEQWISSKAKNPWPDGEYYQGKWVKPFVLTDIYEVQREIENVDPDIIIALGNTALWALTGQDSISKWRGSQMVTDIPLADKQYKVVPTYHPSAILRKWDWRQIAVLDLKRARRELTHPDRPKRSQIAVIQPNYDDIDTYLSEIERDMQTQKIPLVLDLEIKRQAILCIGLARSRDKAVCLPFWHEVHPLALTGDITSRDTAAQLLSALDPLSKVKNVTVRYWPEHIELEFIYRLRDILSNTNVQLINQNIAFDLQFIWSYWFCSPKAYFDTMIAQHVMLPGTPKALDYLHSIYGDEYLYWKDDAKNGDDKFWKDNAKVNYKALWEYNCKDCLTTFEIYEKQLPSLKAVNLHEQFTFQMQKLNNFAISMYRGVAINEQRRTPLLLELIKLTEYMRYEVSYLAGRDLNPNSPKQLIDFFYGELKQPVVLSKENRPTCNDEALKIIGLRDPLLSPITTRLNLIRSYNTSISVCRSRANRWTKRWHTSYNTGGTETFRCSSSQNVWDEAMNVQNLTKGKEIAK